MPIDPEKDGPPYVWTLPPPCFGCVDGYKGCEELEIACRRYLMRYIDIGMDVHRNVSVPACPHFVADQIGDPVLTQL